MKTYTYTATCRICSKQYLHEFAHKPDELHRRYLLNNYKCLQCDRLEGQ